MIHINKSVWKLLKDAPRPSILKIFLYIALNQPDDGIYGFRSTKIQLIVDLESSQTSVFRDLKWLKDNLLIQELKLAEDFDFMANPYHVMNNSDFEARKAEWSRRQRLDIEREQRLRKEKRLRQFRDAKKQQKNAPN